MIIKTFDTVLHSHIKMINMLAKKVTLHFLELLYFAPDRYLYVSDIGIELIKIEICSYLRELSCI